MNYICQTCNTDLYEGASFCPRCGRYTDAITPTAPPLEPATASTAQPQPHNSRPPHSGWRGWVFPPLLGVLVGSMVGVAGWAISDIGSRTIEQAAGNPSVPPALCVVQTEAAEDSAASETRIASLGRCTGPGQVPLHDLPIAIRAACMDATDADGTTCTIVLPSPPSRP